MVTKFRGGGNGISFRLSCGFNGGGILQSYNTTTGKLKENQYQRLLEEKLEQSGRYFECELRQNIPSRSGSISI